MIRVVGKQIPQRIFALLGGPELAASDNFKSFLDLHQRAINGYRAMEWADASFALAAAEKDFPTGVDLTGANLNNADLSEADLVGVNLSEADLSEADLSEANLSRANLSKADLRDALLRTANLDGASLV